MQKPRLASRCFTFDCDEEVEPSLARRVDRRDAVRALVSLGDVEDVDGVDAVPHADLDPIVGVQAAGVAEPENVWKSSS